MNATSSSPSSGAAPNYAQSEAKRRRLRKGTHSCWECKRRKMKCIFDLLADTTTCKGCRRRGFKCVSQEFPEDASLDGVVVVEPLHNVTGSSIYDRRTPTTPSEDGGRAVRGIPTPASMISEPLAFYESSEVRLPDSDIVMIVPDSSASHRRKRFSSSLRKQISEAVSVLA
jgi:hypothetical protein